MSLPLVAQSRGPSLLLRRRRDSTSASTQAIRKCSALSAHKHASRCAHRAAPARCGGQPNAAGWQTRRRGRQFMREREARAWRSARRAWPPPCWRRPREPSLARTRRLERAEGVAGPPKRPLGCSAQSTSANQNQIGGAPHAAPAPDPTASERARRRSRRCCALARRRLAASPSPPRRGRASARSLRGNGRHMSTTRGATRPREEAAVRSEERPPPRASRWPPQEPRRSAHAAAVQRAGAAGALMRARVSSVQRSAAARSNTASSLDGGAPARCSSDGSWRWLGGSSTESGGRECRTSASRPCCGQQHAAGKPCAAAAAALKRGAGARRGSRCGHRLLSRRQRRHIHAAPAAAGAAPAAAPSRARSFRPARGAAAAALRSLHAAQPAALRSEPLPPLLLVLIAWQPVRLRRLLAAAAKRRLPQQQPPSAGAGTGEDPRRLRVLPLCSAPLQAGPARHRMLVLGMLVPCGR